MGLRGEDVIDGKNVYDADEPMSATVLRRTSHGWLEGERKALVTEDGCYYSFKGIPYAKPPLGALRFKAPEPPDLWEGIRKATEHGPICPQKVEPKIECTTRIGHEDCLYLNVYTPEMEPANLLPVMVFIHCGGFRYGSGDEHSYGPDFLVRKGVILVTFNYRLASLGFLCLENKEVPGNAGLKDQVAVLRWVQKNIKHFGGDAENVTVFGESSSGVALHVISPMSANLFHRAILLGGIPMCDWSVDPCPKSRAVTLAYLMGLEVEEPDSSELLKYLQSVPIDHLVLRGPCLFRSEDMHNYIINMSHFSSVVEKDFGQERFLLEDPELSLKNGNVNKVAVMVGYANASALDRIDYIDNAYEVYQKAPEIFVPRRILKDASKHKITDISNRIRNYYFPNNMTMKDFMRYIADCCCLLGTYRYMRHLSYTFMGLPAIYFFRFCAVTERSFSGEEGRKKLGISGASQEDMMAHLFDPKHAMLKLDKQSQGYRMVELLTTITTNFAKIGKPFVDDCYMDVVWCEYDYFAESYMDLNVMNQDVTLTPGAALNDEVVDFWKSLYEYAEVNIDM